MFKIFFKTIQANQKAVKIYPNGKMVNIDGPCIKLQIFTNIYKYY